MDKIALQPSAVVITANPSSPELTLREVGVMLTRRRFIIYVSLLICFLLAILALIVSTRRYKSVGEIELQRIRLHRWAFRRRKTATRRRTRSK
jgi:polysaccharide biosynthesis transport protein